mmetsp:Transcript_26641/g.74473  ORF Transcript_26641/g.74473 Transcript_26641/m.74473 type:complete len:447 (-) Transcript_26641:793-2133(-)
MRRGGAYVSTGLGGGPAGGEHLQRVPPAHAERVECGGGNVRGGEARLFDLLGGRAVLDEVVGQRHGPHLDLAVQQAGQGQVLQHVAPEAPHRPLLHRDHCGVLLSHLREQLGVQGLAEARVHHRGLHPLVGEQLRGGHGGVDRLADGHQRDVRPAAAHHPLAHLQRCALEVGADARLGEVHAEAVAAREAHGRGPVVDGDGGGHHVQQLGLVGGRHDHHVGHAREVRQVEGPAVRGPVSAHQARAVQREPHGQLLQRHVVDDLVVRALQEGGVDGADRDEALAGEAGGEGHGVLLGDADVERAVREVLLEPVHPRAPSHGGVHAHHPGVLLRLGHQAVGEKVGVALRRRGLLVLLAGGRVVGDHAVHLIAGLLRRQVALPLLRDDVQQHRPERVGVLDLVQDVHEILQVVPVHGPHVVHPQLLEERRPRAGDHPAGVLVQLGGDLG